MSTRRTSTGDTAKKIRVRTAPVRLTAARLAEMIEEATVDAYGEPEQLTGWLTMLEKYVVFPFETVVLGALVRVTRIDQSADERLIALCERGADRQAIGLVDLPLPVPSPAGAEWIEGYRRWIDHR